MDYATENILSSISSIVSSSDSRAQKAKRIADTIKEFGHYRWVGVYDVDPELVSAIAWSGPAAPAYPVFPVTKGLTASAIREKATVVVGDVSKDPRYLTCQGTTLSEIIVPVPSTRDGNVIGTIDVESEKPNAFADRDRQILEQCARAALPLWFALR
ncbi:MAG: GAF domain-containing protein [Candidatus Acidiferrales bacterium]